MVRAPAPRSAPPPLSVGLLAVPETSAAVLYSLHEVFRSVGTLWSDLTGEPVSVRRLLPRVIAGQAVPFRCCAGAPIAPDLTFATSGTLDLVVVPDLAVSMADDPRGRWPAAADWLRGQYAAGAIVASVCTGSLLLADAGLLDRRDATTHWAARAIFSTCYPAVQLRPERVLVPAGPEHRLITSGGSAAWAELALYLIARLCGREEAIRITKVFLLGDRSDGQLPFAAMARPRQHDDAVIADCQGWIAAHYAAPHPVRQMCARSGLTVRTFKRRFRRATGYSPIDYVQSLRIEEAKYLLETTDAATDQIGAEVGYEDPASFRKVFKRLTGVTPARYRQRTKGVPALAAPT